MYADQFSHDFLTPLSDSDTQFKLEPHQNLDLSRYYEMLQNINDGLMGINGPDLLGNVYAPRGNIQVLSPYLEVSAFNPRSRVLVNSRRAEKRNEITSTGLTTPRVRARRSPAASTTANLSSSKNKPKNYWKPWKRKTVSKIGSEKLLIPLPIPHPVHIAISIYNRDSDQPISMESDLCWDILRSIEDCHGDLQAVARYSGRINNYGNESSNGDNLTGGESESLESLGTQSQSSGCTKDSMDMIAAGGTETLPCTNRNATIVVSTNEITPTETTTNNATGYHWTLSNWGATQQSRRRQISINSNNNGNNTNEIVRVDLASPEDISLDTDSSRAVFSAYGTTV